MRDGPQLALVLPMSWLTGTLPIGVLTEACIFPLCPCTPTKPPTAMPNPSCLSVFGSRKPKWRYWRAAVPPRRHAKIDVEPLKLSDDMFMLKNCRPPVGCARNPSHGPPDEPGNLPSPSRPSKRNATATSALPPYMVMLPLLPVPVFSDPK